MISMLLVLQLMFTFMFQLCVSRCGYVHTLTVVYYDVFAIEVITFTRSGCVLTLSFCL